MSWREITLPREHLEAEMIRKLLPRLAIAALSLAMLDIHAGQAASQTLEKIKEIGKIAFGYREASIPFAYLGADNKPTGLSLELCAAVPEQDQIRIETAGAGDRVHPGECIQPHSTSSERHHRHRVRQHDQHRRTAKAGFLFHRDIRGIAALARCRDFSGYRVEVDLRGRRSSLRKAP